MVGVAERLYALPLKLGGDGVEVAPATRGVGERPLRRPWVGIERASDPAVVGERAQRLLGHRVDHVGTNQLGDVEHVGVGRVLGASAGPQRPLWAGALIAQTFPLG